MTLRPGSTKKQKKEDGKSVLQAVKDGIESLKKPEKTPVFGVTAISKLLGFSPRTAHRWRFEFHDFPVTSDGNSCVWQSTVEDLQAWKEKHSDLFVLHKERAGIVSPKRVRRW